MCLSCFQLNAFIIIEVNVIVNDLFCFFKGGDWKWSERFCFQMREKFFHRSIIPTIARARHGRRDAISLGQESITLRDKLVAMITVQEQSFENLFVLFGLSGSFENQSQWVYSVEPIGHCISKWAMYRISILPFRWPSSFAPGRLAWYKNTSCTLFLTGGFFVRVCFYRFSSF